MIDEFSQDDSLSWDSCEALDINFGDLVNLSTDSTTPTCTWEPNQPFFIKTEDYDTLLDEGLKKWDEAIATMQYCESLSAAELIPLLEPPYSPVETSPKGSMVTVTTDVSFKLERDVQANGFDRLKLEALIQRKKRRRRTKKPSKQNEKELVVQGPPKRRRMIAKPGDDLQVVFRLE
jgi:hypothetical protein